MVERELLTGGKSRVINKIIKKERRKRKKDK
jgi:hypothetical protein